MSTPVHFPLGRLHRPEKLLAGLRVPLVSIAHTKRPTSWLRFEWCGDRLLTRLCSDGAWVEKTIEEMIIRSVWPDLLADIDVLAKNLPLSDNLRGRYLVAAQPGNLRPYREGEMVIEMGGGFHAHEVFGDGLRYMAALLEMEENPEVTIYLCEQVDSNWWKVV